MTTIATDGRSMAGDGPCTGNGLVHGFDTQKVFKLEDGRIVGMCGTAYGMPVFVEWLNGGGEKPKLFEGFEALVLSPDGTCRTYNEECQSCSQQLPAITGSGGAVALGAMLAGASPERAVEIAAMRDQSTGGIITVEYLETPNGNAA